MHNISSALSGSPKIIFSDFDGTLVGKDLMISERLRNAITKWEDRGNLFTLATGRMFAGHVERIGEELHLVSPQVTMGGAQIIDPVKKIVIAEDVMPDEEVIRLAVLLEKKKIYFWAEKDFTIYNLTGEARTASHSTIPHKKLSEISYHKIPKIAIRPESEEEKAWISSELVEMFPQLHIMRAGSAFGLVYDVTDISTTKHTGVLKVIDMLHLPREHTIGVGDGYNDFPLLTVAGYKVAMGNAPEDLKEIADFVTTSQAEDGVAVMIEKLLDR